MRITQKVNDVYNAKLSAYYFYVKTKISVGFQICISVPLNYASVDIVNDEGSFQVSPKAEFTSPLYVHITLAIDTESELLLTAAVNNMLKLLAFK